MILDIFKVFLPSAVAFFIGIALTPMFAGFLYRHRLWKKRAGKVAPDGQPTPIFNQLHKEREVGTPRMGGVIIWSSTLITVCLFWLLAVFFPGASTGKLNFLSRNQTWLPLFTLLAASLVGLIDDILQIRPTIDQPVQGLRFRHRLMMVGVIGLIGAWWFFSKLGVNYLFIPFVGEAIIGWWFIPLFVLVMLALFSSGVIDGLDGLAGGVMAIIFAAYSGIAFFQQQIDLAALGAAITGAILAFLWFNIPPARFYMSETGMLGLTATLTVMAFLTNSVLTLPLIALPLTMTSLSVIIQLTSKKFRGKKVFLVAPLHHHFEAIGWPAYKVVMRYWVIGVIFAIIGMVLTLIGRL